MIKSFCAALLCICFSAIACAQNTGGGADDEILGFGFTFQYISSNYKIFKKASWRDPYFDTGTNKYITDSLTRISSPSGTGFGIGFVTKVKLNENLDIRFTPGLAFSDKFVNFEDRKTSNQRTIASTTADFPLGIKLKSDRRGNFRAYILTGVKYSMDIASKKKTDDSGFAPREKFIKNNKKFLSYEAAIGFDLYFEYFKMSPELKLSNSFRNVLKPEDHPYSTPLDKLMLHSVQFSLFFE